MELVIQVCSTVNEIKNRFEKYLPDVKYDIIGEDRDYTIVLDDVDEDYFSDLEEIFEDVIYGTGELTLAETLVEMLGDNGLMISFAESCTGGMLTSSVVDVAGSSKVLYEGLVTYSNGAKTDRLGVSVDTLIENGAVSKETVIEMAKGLLTKKASIGVAITGVAGPQGGTLDKPVGLVYIAVISGKHLDVYKNYFTGDRNSVRNQAKNCALFFTITHIKNNF